MARALVGYVGNSSDQLLALEVARLRRRVSDLEAELAELKATPTVELDLELHRMTQDAGSVLA